VNTISIHSGRKTSVEDKETKQISLLQGSGVPVRKNLHGQRPELLLPQSNRLPERR